MLTFRRYPHIYRPRPRVPQWAGLVVLGGFIIGGCGVGERPTFGEQSLNPKSPTALLEDQPAVDDGIPADVLDSFEPPPLPALESLESTPPVLITPTGIIVPVIGREGDAYLVQTPCGNESQVAWGHPLQPVEVVVDPGHGGVERGAVGPNDETEADLNLDIARRVATMLEGAGVSTALTRTGDYRVPIRTRATIADRLGASAFVSIHHNSPSIEPSPVPGSEVYVQVGSEESRRLGGLIYEEVFSHLQVFDVEWTSAANPGVLTVINSEGENAYGINRYPQTPAVLAELAYLSNPGEATLLASDDYRQTAATAVTRGILRFLQSTDPGSGFVDQPRLFTPSGTTGGSDDCEDPVLE